MKMVRNSLIYDTDKAEQLTEHKGRFHTFLGHGDPIGRHREIDFFKESLYRTPSGRWFLLGQGSDSSSKTIVPLSHDEAREYCEKTQETEILLKYFLEDLEEA